MDLREVGC